MTMEPAICNAALKISLQWGPERKIPFATRLGEIHPNLTAAEAEALEKESHEIESAAWSSVVQHMKTNGMNDRLARAAWTKPLIARWPWLNQDNLSMLWTQGCYFAWHDGELG
jgi:hypothetical protein